MADESENAASRAANILRYHLTGSAPEGQEFFKHLGVTVRDDKVYSETGLLNDELGSLAGARAGVVEKRELGPLAGLISYELVRTRPKIGTVFVEGGGSAPGSKEVGIREERFTGEDDLWAEVLQEINDFNRLADAAGHGALKPKPGSDPDPDPELGVPEGQDDDPDGNWTPNVPDV